MKSPKSVTSESLKKVGIPSAGTLFMIVALCVLGGMGWIIISEKEEYLVQRNFRLLKLWSQDISSKIEGYQQVFKFSANGIRDALHSKTQYTSIDDNKDRRRSLRKLRVPYNDPSHEQKVDSQNLKSSMEDSSGNSPSNQTPFANKHIPFIRPLIPTLIEKDNENDRPKADEHSDMLEKVSPWSCALNSRIRPTSGPITRGKDNASKPNENKRYNAIIENLHLQLTGMCLAEGLTTITLTQASAEKGKGENTEIFELSVNHSQKAPIIQLTYITNLELDHGNEFIKIKGDINLKSFLTRLFKEPIFDEVVLFDSVPPKTKGDEKKFPLLFDSGSQEFSWTNFHTIIEKSAPSESFWSKFLSKPQDASELRKQLTEQNSPNQFLVKLPGKTNNVFTLPVIVSGNGNTAWRLVGMIDHDTFQNSYLAISSSVLLGVMFLILGLLLSIPFLHLKTMGAKDPLRMSHILTIILAAFLGTGAFTFLVLDWAIYDDGTDTLRERMKSAAETMKRKVHEELWSVLSTLNQFDQSGFLKVDISKLDTADREAINKKKKASEEEDSEEIVSSASDKRENIYPTPLSVGKRSVLLEVFKQEDAQEMSNRQCNALTIKERRNCYPDFLNAFWMDHDGSLRINWASNLARGVTTNLPLQERRYVREVQKEEPALWRMADKTGTEKFQFFLEPIISWTTGENTVVASMRSSALTEEEIKSWVAAMEFTFPSQMDQVVPPPRRGFTITEPNKPWVAAMEFKFLSLMDQVVLPPGIGFAVIEKDTHQVLFHSKEGRNLREDFLVETDQNQQLRDLLAAGTTGHVNGSYWGKARSFYTLPLRPLPWALVVYRDREILQSINLFGLVIAGGIYGLWSLIVYLIAWVLLRLNSKHRKAVCLWPKIADHPHYVKLIQSNVVIFIVGIFSLWILSTQPSRQLITALLIIPSLCLFMAFFLIKWEWSKKLVHQCYSLFGAQIAGFIGKHYGNARTQWHRFFNNSQKQKPSWLTIRNSYAYLASSFLLVFAVIPAFGCFSSVFHKEMTLLTQYQLLETFKSFQDSRKPTMIKPVTVDLEKEFNTDKKITLHQDCGAALKNRNESYGFYPDFFLKTQWSKCDNPDEPAANEPEIFDQFFALVSQPFLPLLKNVPLWGFIEEPWRIEEEIPDDQRPIRWDKEWDKKAETFFKNFTVRLTESQFQVRSILPLQPWFLGYNLDFSSVTLGKTIKYLLITGLFMIWIRSIPKFIATRIVFLNYPTPFQVPQELLFDRPITGSSWSNQLILGFPGQGKTPKALPADKKKELQHTGGKETRAEEKNEAKGPNSAQPAKLPPYPLYFDLKAIPPEEWKEELSQKISSLKPQLAKNQDLHVIIDHLERQWKDPTINFKKLELMEWLLNRSYHTRNLVIEVDEGTSLKKHKVPTK